MEVRRFRDLSLWEVGDTSFVLACDSNASVGSLPGDFLQRPPHEAGYNAAKVVLMEVLASGAWPFLVVNTLCGPLDDYGQQVVSGIRTALREVGCEAPITGSDETNMPTVQTGVGVTMLGHARRSEIRLGGSRAGDLVLCLGNPRDGVRLPYDESDLDVAKPVTIRRLIASGAHEVLPVGSRGVDFELGELARGAGVTPQPLTTPLLDRRISAGASTCVLASCAPEDLGTLTHATALPVTVVAELGPA